MNNLTETFQEADVGIKTNKTFQAKPSIKATLKGKLSLMHFSPKNNYNLLSTENTIGNATNSPFNGKRMNSLQINSLSKNDLFKETPSKTNINNYNLKITNSNYNPHNLKDNSVNNDQNTIKTKFNNQSELSVSLNFLRGKSLKQTDLAHTLNELNYKKDSNKNNTFHIKYNNKKNFNNTKIHLNDKYNTQNAFSKFFKKPLSFRIDEFEEINKIENNDIHKENKAYAQQRFFGNTISDNNLAFNAKSSNNNLNDTNLNYQYDKTKLKNSNLDDIEKVTLVNNREELVKKYVLPEMKYLTVEERKKLIKYDVHDQTEKFVINKRQAIFLADLLKVDINMNRKSKIDSSVFKKVKSNEKYYDPRKTEIDVSETKYGMYPKFLMRTSSFVRYVDSAYKENENNKEKYQPISFSKTIVPKKLNFKNALSLNNNNCNSTNLEENLFPQIQNQQLRNSSLSVKNKFQPENAFGINNKSDNSKTTKNSKNSFSGFNFNFNNYNNNHLSSTSLKFGSPVNTAKAPNNNIRISTDSISNFNTNKIKNNLRKDSNTNVSDSDYLNSQVPEINSITKKNNRLVILDYPQVKFPIQPYKKFDHKANKDNNYLTNGSMLDDPQVIDNIKKSNQQIASNFQNEKEVCITNEMSQNIDKLNVIEGKINKLIQNSKKNMKENRDYRRFNSNSSIVIIK